MKHLYEKIMKQNGNRFIDKVESFINKDKIRMLRKVCRGLINIKCLHTKCDKCSVQKELTKLGGKS